MFNNPKRAKKLFFDVIPKTIDEYYSFLSKYNSNSECELDNPVWHIHKSNPPKDIFPVSFNLLLNLSSVCNLQYVMPTIQMICGVIFLITHQS